MMKTLAMMMGTFAVVKGQSAESAECAADISGDGEVAVDDLLALLASFGSTCIVDSSGARSLALASGLLAVR